jgi:hypothetical protein
MSAAFALGSTGFLLGPAPAYLALVGPVADAITFFVGSLLFTACGALQVWLAVPSRREAGAGRAAWGAAVIQFAGTLFFNATTFRALHTALSSPSYDRLVWRPDAFGSICFLVRAGRLPSLGAPGLAASAGSRRLVGAGRRPTGPPRRERSASWPAPSPVWSSSGRPAW